MLSRICKLLLCAMLASVATSAVAQGKEWSFQGSLYLFAAETDLSVGDVKTTLSFSDALENLDFAGMASFSATNNQWSFVGDLMYFNLGFENDLPGTVFSRSETDQKNTIFTGYALYRIYDTPTATVDLGGGFRYFRTETNVSLRSEITSTRRAGTKDSWTDPILAAQARVGFSDAWSSMLAVDYGSFLDDRETYSATVTLDYEFNENWVGRLGYRYINVEDKGRDLDFRFEQSGPILGATYRF